MSGIAHGTPKGYTHGGCREACCRDAVAARAATRRRLIAYGRWQGDVDAEPVREHVQWLVSQGLPWERIPEVTGVGRRCIQGLLYPIGGHPPSRKVRASNAAKILAVTKVTDDMRAPHDRVDATGTRRRVHALMAIGYSIDRQALLLGRSPDAFHRVLKSPRVTLAVAGAVRDLYDRLSMTPAPDDRASQQARRRARERGYLSPLAWDDDLIDLPDAELEEECRRRAEEMSDAECARCVSARGQGDRSPTILAGAREYRRRQREKEAA